MAAGYEAVREELKGWALEDLLFGFQRELSLSGKGNFDEGLVSVYLDAIEEKLPPAPLPDLCASYEEFRKRIFDKYGTELPPMEEEAG